MNRPDAGDSSRRQKFFNLTIAGVTAQVGCLTLVVVLAAVFGGIWLDNHFMTRPWFTVGLLLASIPLSLGGMFFVVRIAVNKIKTNSESNTTEPTEDRN
jgi:F0F1-type ATP synthase assembly protein I